MRFFARAMAGALVLAAPSVHAQSATPIVAGASDAAVLRTGTKVPLKLEEELSTKAKALRVGQHFNLSVAEAVTVNGGVVIPVGAPAVGEVTEVRNKGMWGKSGHITAQVLYLTVNGRQVRLNGTFDEKGTTGTAGVVGAIAFVPIAGFLMTGTSAVIQPGAAVTAFIGEDVPVAMAAAAPAPLMAQPVAAPPPAPVAKPITASLTTGK